MLETKNKNISLNVWFIWLNLKYHCTKKIKFSVKDSYSKCEHTIENCNLFTSTKEILNGKLQFFVQCYASFLFTFWNFGNQTLSWQTNFTAFPNTDIRCVFQPYRNVVRQYFPLAIYFILGIIYLLRTQNFLKN